MTEYRENNLPTDPIKDIIPDPVINKEILNHFSNIIGNSDSVRTPIPMLIVH